MQVNECGPNRGNMESVLKEYEVTKKADIVIKQLLILGMKKPALNSVPVFRNKAGEFNMVY